ncbi:MAG: NADH-quinone oxidoreductase subunit N, partial [Chthoniobacterales bacterium]|nr:NADH-quinone oxidoreductase subunit N [Chthoniobacterales bacterium]
MSYLELLQLAAPEAILVVTALVVLTIGLVTGRGLAGDPPAGRPASLALCSLVAVLGLAIAAAVVVRLPAHAMLFHGMLVISPLNSLAKLLCLVLAFFSVLLVRGERSLPNPGEYLALILLATVGLLLLVGSEELLMIFIGLELTGLSLYVLAAFDKAEQRSAEAG